VAHPPDLFVADGLVWAGDVAGSHTRERTAIKREGRDPRTGEVKRTVEVPNLISPLHHFRCYRSKATDRFLLLTKRGVEFVDLEADDHMRNDWLRAGCSYGFLPCNGLLYVTSHHCFCYPAVRMNGFLALAATTGERKAEETPRLERGPAYGGFRVQGSGFSNEGDWPTYRCDAARSGRATEDVPVEVARAWQTKLGGRLSQPVVADGKLFVAQVDAHGVHALDAAGGKKLWSYTAGGRVDSPPTIHEGLVLFGCRDGWVYCLRAEDGELAWRFRAAPEERRVVFFDQIESAWPVPGSVLVQNGVAYVCAGRSSFLDGGVYLCGLEP
jgi:outer membrane protein assembly factor BamB